MRTICVTSIFLFFSCTPKPETPYAPPPVTKRWYAKTRAEADSIGLMNWIDAKGLRQGWWCIIGGMEKDPKFAPYSKVEEGFYLDNKKEGVWLYYEPNGTVRDSVEYKNGVEVK